MFGLGLRKPIGWFYGISLGFGAGFGTSKQKPMVPCQLRVQRSSLEPSFGRHGNFEGPGASAFLLRVMP